MSEDVSKFVFTSFLGLDTLSQVIRMSLYFQYREGALYMEICFQGDRGEGQSVLLALSGSEVILFYFILFYFILFIMAAPTACGSSQVRDGIQAEHLEQGWIL